MTVFDESGLAGMMFINRYELMGKQLIEEIPKNAVQVRMNYDTGTKLLTCGLLGYPKEGMKTDGKLYIGVIGGVPVLLDNTLLINEWVFDVAE
jgi:hypothetical protein